MTASDLRQAFPLAQATGVAASLDEWLAFSDDTLRVDGGGTKGMRALVNQQGIIVGLIVFALAGDPRHGTVFEITHLIALNRVTAESLIQEGTRIAHGHDCSLVRTNVSVGDLWLGDLLRRRGFTLERHQLTRALEPHLS